MKSINIFRLLLLVIAILAIGFIVVFLRNNKVADLRNEVVSLNETNSALQVLIEEKDAAFLQQEGIMGLYTDSILKEKERRAQLQRQYAVLQNSYKNLAKTVSAMSADESYVFLTTEAYPYPGEPKYGFNEPQVKTMHLTYLEKREVLEVNSNLISQAFSCELELTMQERRYEEARKSIMLMGETRKYMEEIIDNQGVVINYQNRQITKEQNRKNLWKGGAVIAFIVGVLL